MGFNDVLMLAGCFGIGGFLVLAAVYTASRAVASRSWPQAPGEVTWGRLAFRGSSGWSSHRVAQVEYDYWVQDGRYSGDRLRFAVWGLDGEGRDSAQARIDRYPVRSAIVVRYNPERPDDAVVETRPDWNSIALCASLGLLFIAFGLYMALVILGIVPAWD